jgi:hypothetical protein
MFVGTMLLRHSSRVSDVPVEHVTKYLPDGTIFYREASTTEP